MKIQGFDLSFKPGGWGCKPVVNGTSLPESFSTQGQAIEWLKSRNIRFELQCASAAADYENMTDE